MADVVNWAETMVEPLRARALEAERLRRLPDETVEEASAVGFVRALMPNELGGAESGEVPFFQYAVNTTAQVDWKIPFYDLGISLQHKYTGPVQGFRNIGDVDNPEIVLTEIAGYNLLHLSLAKNWLDENFK